MKKRILVNIFVIFVCVAMISAATMAWFTDLDTAGEATFTAGTVSIEAGGTAVLSQYYDPSTAVYLYGVEAGTGDLYEIDVLNRSVNRFYDTEMSSFGSYDSFSPNGLAFDNKSRRLYFSVVNGSNSTLWFYDLKNKVLEKASITAENRVIYGSAFGDGCYWYIANNTDALYKISFDVNGKVTKSEFVANITGDEKNKFGFGDVVMDIKDGVIYGSSTTGVFFKYEITSRHYGQIKAGGSNLGLQLAFGSDGSLYGHNTTNEKWYTVDSSNGSIQESFVGEKSFNDLASGYVSVWNPGDTDKLKYFVKNTGSKKIRVRAQLSGQWDDDTLDTDVVEISPCESTPWFIGSGGYYYYNGILEPGQSAELCVVVHLNGPDTGDTYQGRTFTLSGMMYAIQASNDAPLIEWGEDFVP